MAGVWKFRWTLILLFLSVFSGAVRGDDDEVTDAVRSEANLHNLTVKEYLEREKERKRLDDLAWDYILNWPPRKRERERQKSSSDEFDTAFIQFWKDFGASFSDDIEAARFQNLQALFAKEKYELSNLTCAERTAGKEPQYRKFLATILLEGTGDKRVAHLKFDGKEKTIRYLAGPDKATGQVIYGHFGNEPTLTILSAQNGKKDYGVTITTATSEAFCSGLGSPEKDPNGAIPISGK